MPLDDVPATYAMIDIVFLLFAYCLGSLSFAVLVSWAFRLPDPRSYGSGNPGATNVLRTGKRAAAVFTLLGDGGKGWLAVFLTQILGTQWDIGPATLPGVVLLVFMGHLWPIFFRFQGGKGVATAGGILFAIDPWLGLGTVLTWLVIAYFFRYSSLAALTAGLFAPFGYVGLYRFDAMAVAILIVALLLFWRHRENIQRLVAGTEGRIGGQRAAAAHATAASTAPDSKER